MHSRHKKEYRGGRVLKEYKDSLVAESKPSTSAREVVALHRRGSLKLTTEEEEKLQEMEEEEAKVEELPIIATNAISWGIDHLSVQIM